MYSVFYKFLEGAVQIMKKCYESKPCDVLDLFLMNYIKLVCGIVCTFSVILFQINRSAP